MRRKHAILEVLKLSAVSPVSVFRRKLLDSQSSNPTEAGRWFWIGFSIAQTPPKLQTSLYGFVLLCERRYCHSFLLDRDIPEQKKNSLKWSMSDQMRRRRHTGKQGQGSEVRVHRVRSLIGKNKTKTKLHFLLNFVLLTVCLEPSVQLRIPARCSKEPAASFSSSSSSGLTSRRGLLLTGHLMAGGRWEVSWRPLSSQRSESSSLWKPSLPARRDCLPLQPPSSREDRDEEEEREEQRCKAMLL